MTLLVVALVATMGVAGTASAAATGVTGPTGAAVTAAQTQNSIPADTATADTATADATLSNHTSITLDNQTSGGHTVTVQNVTLAEGGFVVLHDSTLADGNVLGSVVGSSSYLDPGTHENVTVRLESPLSNDTTLTAMAHRDTDGDRVYEFVSASGTADGPYTANGSAVVDPGTITVSASVSVSDQPTDNRSVVIDRVELSEPGFVVIHNETLLTEGDAVGSVVGNSELLPAGVHENVRVTLDSPVGNETIVAMPHRDTNDNAAYDFPDADGPFTNAEGGAVVDPAAVTVESTASVTFADQTSGGTAFTVESVFLPEGGYVVLHDERLAEGEAVASVRGNSSYLEPGLHRNVRITLEEPIENATTLTAMPHRETNGNELYEFPDADGPYTADGSAVVDGGNVSVSASVDAATQESDGRTVVIDSVDLAEGGFVVIHDASLFAGEVAGSVLGNSQYLEAGYHEDVEVTLDRPANETQQLVAMAHRDTDGDQTYDFPDADGPYTDNGSAVVDSFTALVTSSVTFGAQESEGGTVVVESVTLADGGFVTIHDGTLLDGDALGSVRGTSTYLPPGTHKNVEVTLEEPLRSNATLIAMPHRDTDGDQTYDFVTSEGATDGPYVASGGAVVHAANVTYTGEAMTETETETTETETTETDTTETTETDSMGTDAAMTTEQSPETETETTGPGFTGLLAVLALAGVAALAVRRRP